MRTYSGLEEVLDQDRFPELWAYENEKENDYARESGGYSCLGDEGESDGRAARQ